MNIKEDKLRAEWREEIKKYPEMDALGSADWWIKKVIATKKQCLECAPEKVKATWTIGKYPEQDIEANAHNKALQQFIDNINKRV